MKCLASTYDKYNAIEWGIDDLFRRIRMFNLYQELQKNIYDVYRTNSKKKLLIFYFLFLLRKLSAHAS